MANLKRKSTSRTSQARKSTKSARSSNARTDTKGASQLIDRRIRETGGWRGETLARMRALILEADPEMVEECKWVKPSNPLGVPVWSHAGIVCTGEVYKEAVKLTFARGASLADPKGLFNASLDGNTRRAIDIGAGQRVDAAAFKALVKVAVALNEGGKAKAPKGSAKAAKPSAARQGEKVVLLSGGNPQVAKADGDAPVQVYLAAMPGWKREVGRRLDALVTRSVPKLRKAVRWNSPFYGVEGKGWFLSFHCFAKYVKVTFLRGTALRPMPPVTSKDPNTRYLHIHEHDELDEKRLTSWLEQAAKVPGDPLF